MKDINNKKILMAHIVAGYPTRAKSLKLARALVDAGARMLEVQIPFSDPIADGPIIVGACHSSLENGFVSSDIFQFVGELRNLKVPISVMTYANIPFSIGFHDFAKKIKSSGTSSLIVPDLPYDSQDGIALRKACEKHSLNLIQVVSPNMDKLRLNDIIKISTGFIYSTTRKGTTGKSASTNLSLISFLKALKRMSKIPIAVGFGISTPKDIAYLKEHSDILIVGSAIIDKAGKHFSPGPVLKFIRSMRKELDI